MNMFIVVGLVLLVFWIGFEVGQMHIETKYRDAIINYELDRYEK